MMLSCLLALSAPAQATDWTVSVDPLTAALGFAHVQVERRLGDSWSLYAGPHLRLYDAPWAPEPEDYTGLGLEAGLRWFPGAAAPKGAWLMTRGVAAHLHTPGWEQSTLGGYGSLLAGYTLILGDRWVLAGGAGAQYLHYTIDGMGPKGVFPALHTNVGIAF